MLRKSCASGMSRVVVGAGPCAILRASRAPRLDARLSAAGIFVSHSSSWPSSKARRTFIEYFESHEHTFVPSSSIIPKKDSGTYFVNAGMNQFKSLFLGVSGDSGMPNLKRAVNSQKCIRVGGKHNDLDEVGADTYHHTFFEMLGNWSFGDYFKAEACALAWKLLTEVYGIPAERLYVTYFAGDDRLGLGPDSETRDIWLSLGLNRDRVLPFGSKANFWEMAETGPCGPCTEIHYDHVGGRDASSLVNASSPEVIELWNLVFIQFNRIGAGELRPLPCRHVDTGMGLERLCTVLQGVRSNYDTDLFVPILAALSKGCSVPAYSGTLGSTVSGSRDAAFRTVADHARMYTVAIADGLLPCVQSEESGHKLRQVMHRTFKALRRTLQAPPGIACSLVDPVVRTLEVAYPQLASKTALVKEVVSQEENNYLAILSSGYDILQQLRQQKNGVMDSLSADDIQDIASGRYGDAPSVDVMYEVAEECGIPVKIGSHASKDDQLSMGVKRGYAAESASTPAAFTSDVTALPPSLGFDLQQINCTVTDDRAKYAYSRSPTGSYEFQPVSARLLALWSYGAGSLVTKADIVEGTFLVVLDRTGFYSEAGGQQADAGVIIGESFEAEVRDVQHVQSYVVHRCILKSGVAEVGADVVGHIDQAHRLKCMRNHSATHLLNAALRKVVGPDVRQCGSHVASDKLTLAFSCLGDVSLSHIKAVEEIVKASIAAGAAADACERSLATARKAGDRVIALQEEVYPSQVRVVSFGAAVDTVLHDAGITPNGFLCAELCCGTHVLNSADLGDFAIVNLAGTSQGTKRLTAVTGELATEAYRKAGTIRHSAAKLLEDVTRGVDAGSWDERLRDINKGCSEDLLPKVAREEIFEFLASSRLHEKIHRVYNARSHMAFEEEVEALLQKQAGELVAVAACDFDEIKEASKLLRKRVYGKPTALFNRHQATGKINVVCYAPPQSAQPNFVADWAAAIADRLGGGRSGQAKGKNMQHLHIVQAGGGCMPSPEAGMQEESTLQHVTDIVRGTAVQLLGKVSRDAKARSNGGHAAD